MNEQMQRCVSHRSENDISCRGAESCTAPQLQANSPPLKDEIYTVGVKTISRMSFLRSMRSTKKVFLTEHGKQIFHFCNPSRLILTFLGRHARLSSQSGNSWCNWASTTRAGGEDYVSLHNKLPQISDICSGFAQC